MLRTSVQFIHNFPVLGFLSLDLNFDSPIFPSFVPRGHSLYHFLKEFFSQLYTNYKLKVTIICMIFYLLEYRHLIRLVATTLNSLVDWFHNITLILGRDTHIRQSNDISSNLYINH